MRWLSSVFVCLFLFACAATEVVHDGPVVKAGSLLLLPVESAFDELQDEEGEVYQALLASLKERRFTVLAVDAETHQAAIEEALTEAGAIYSPELGRFTPSNKDRYIKALIDYYAEKQPADIVLMPEFVVRRASVSGDWAEWDYVRRKIELDPKPPGPYQSVQQVRGVSLRLAAYTASGAQVMQDFAGVSLPYRIDYTRRPPAFVLKDHFYNRKQINETIALLTASLFRYVEYDER